MVILNSFGFHFLVMANLNPRENGKVSMVALGFILFFNLLCSCIGVAYSFIINPGKPTFLLKYNRLRLPVKTNCGHLERMLR